MTHPQLIADVPCQLGENPLWHPLEKRVYWTDIIRGVLFRYDPKTGQHEECFSGATVGGFTVQADGALLLFMKHGAIARWQEGQLDYLIEEIPAEMDVRFNDVIADPAGRVFCGYLPIVVGSRPGGLYRLDLDGSLQLMLDGVGISNGMGFSRDCKHMYYTDSSKRQIYLFDYDQATGGLTHQRVWLETPEGAGVPDGMTVDAQGHIWSARWDGSALYRYTPDGIEELRIEFPARKVSSVTFGGIDLSDIYVTTALAGGDRANEGTGAGGLFRLQLGIRGAPEYFSRIKL
jgi:sugar lactone lactonase YvrE